MHSLTVLEGRSLKSRCQGITGSWLFLEVLKKKQFHASFLTSCGYQHFSTFPGLQTHRSHLCSHLHMAFPTVSVSVFSPLLTEHQPNWIRTHSNQVWSHLNFITSAETLFPNKVIHRYWVLGLPHVFGETHTQDTGHFTVVLYYWLLNQARGSPWHWSVYSLETETINLSSLLFPQLQF